MTAAALVADVKLKPCPFCGSRPLGPRRRGLMFVVVCVFAQCPASDVVASGFSATAASNHWNTRKEARRG